MFVILILFEIDTLLIGYPNILYLLNITWIKPVYILRY